MRQGKNLKAKIYSDSTLRQANQLALTTDIDCMSGGGIGQICNLLPYDTKHEDIIINAGGNEIRNAPSMQEFVYTVEKAKEKLQKAATRQGNVKLILPSGPKDTPNEIARSTYLEEEIKKIEQIEVIEINDIEYSGFHPTEKGTTDIIKQLNEKLNKEIIMEGCENDIITTLKYSKVRPVYKIGCRGCNTLDYTPDLCYDCKEKAAEVDTKAFEEILNKTTAEMYPVIEEGAEERMSTSSEGTTIADDNELKEVNKRGYEPASDEDDVNCSKKTPRPEDRTE